MDTVKVDIQKLQLLNDRIAQTIEALNQLRMTVHGIHHSPAQVSPWGTYGNSYGMYGQPWVQPGYGTPFTPYGNPYVGSPFTSPFGPGLQHTSFATPTQAFPTFLPQTQVLPTNSWVTPFQNGISHSTWDPTFQSRQQMWDPMWQSRVSYPFPTW